MAFFMVKPFTYLATSDLKTLGPLRPLPPENLLRSWGSKTASRFIGGAMYLHAISKTLLNYNTTIFLIPSTLLTTSVRPSRLPGDPTTSPALFFTDTITTPHYPVTTPSLELAIGVLPSLASLTALRARASSREDGGTPFSFSS